MVRRTPRSTLPAPLFPYTTLFHSGPACARSASNAARSPATPRSKSDSVGHHSSRAPMNGEVPLCTASIANERTCRNAPMRSPSALSRSEEHTSELQSLMRISYAVFCLKKKNINNNNKNRHNCTKDTQNHITHIECILIE